MFDMFTAGVVGMAIFENDQESKVDDLVRDFRYSSVPANMLTQELVRRGISYRNLPQYLKDRIDEIEVY